MNEPPRKPSPSDPHAGEVRALSPREIALLLETLSPEEQAFVQRGAEKNIIRSDEVAEVLASLDPDADRPHIGSLLVQAGKLTKVEYNVLRHQKPKIGQTPASEPAPPPTATRAETLWDPPPPRPEAATLTSTSTEVVSAPRQALAPGIQFGRYRILSEVARGAMGVVYSAKRNDLDRVECLKVILSGDLASPDQINRFFQEAQSAAKLSHPSIVPIYDMGEVNGQYYFTMEFIHGRSLDRIIGGHPLEPAAVALVVMNIAKALHFAHENGVIHRDIKPSNVLIKTHVANGPLSPQDWDLAEIKVTDFGLARQVEKQTQRLTLSNMIMGSPFYMSPEQARGEADRVDVRSDVYSLGAVMYEMLTGKPPLNDLPFNEILRRAGDEKEMVPTPTSLHRAVDAVLEIICLKAMRKNPKHRYASAGAMADDLERYLKGEQIVAKAPGFFERRGWSGFKIAAAAAIVLATAGSGLAFYLTRPGVIKPVEISWLQANRYIGKQVAVEVPVLRSFLQDNEAFLTPKPGDRTAFEAIVSSKNFGAFPAEFQKSYWMKLLKVTGTIQQRGDQPVMVLTGSDQVKILRALRGEERGDWAVQMVQQYVPSDANLIGWEKAVDHLGEVATVEGSIDGVRRTDTAVFMDFHRGDQSAFHLVAFDRSWTRFPADFERMYDGKKVWVAGKILSYRGRPRMYLDAPSQIKVLGGAEKPALATPSTDNLIPDTEALDHLDETKTVEGMVENIQQNEQTTFLNFPGVPGESFSAVIFANRYDRFPEGFAKLYEGKKIRVAGSIRSHQGSPQIIVEDPSQIRIVGKAAAPEKTL